MFRFPIVRLAIFFAIGIFLQKTFGFEENFLFRTTLCLFAGFVLLHVLSLKFPKLGLMASLSSLLVFGLLGSFCVCAHDQTRNDSHYLNYISDGNPVALGFVLREKLKPSANYFRYIANVESVDGQSVNGKILVQIPRKSKPPQIGSVLNSSAVAYLLKPVQNPGQFDYSAYLKNKQIYAQAYVSSLRKTGLRKDIWHYSEQIRNRILANVSKNGFGKSELAVYAALMLGQQQEIDAGIIRDYQYSGAVHILSVSGLHVGFLMLMVRTLLKFLPNSPRWKLFKLVISLLSLWSFAFVAGLSASVVRSAAMFSFLAFGLHIKRGTNIFNTLFASMLVILLFKPGFLFDVGFQLSYLAVFSIVWLKPIIDKRIHSRNKILSYFADILTVSFAAQIGTLPLSLYYFHQFPLLFFATNLAVIPLVGIIMAIGLAAMAWACFGTVPFWLSILCSKSIWLLDTVIGKIASMESFVFKDIGVSLVMLVCSYFAIAMLGKLGHKPTPANLRLALCSVLLLQFSFLWTKRSIETESEWVVFQSKKQTLLAERIGRIAIVYATNSADQNQLDFVIKPYATKNFCKWQTQKLPNLMAAANQKILVIDSSGIIPSRAKPDVLLLANSPRINLERALKLLNPSVVVADGLNFRSAVETWKQTCRKQKIPFHATAEKGSFIMKSAP